MRALPLLVPPAEDETLLSFCRRLAAHNEGSLAGVLRATGLGGDGPTMTVARHMAITVEPGVLAGFAASTGISRRRAEGLLLSSYRGVVDPAACPRGGGQELLHWSRHQGLLGAGSRLCPACVGADGAFRLGWRFAWSFACPQHCLVLQASCPGCGRSHSYDPNSRPSLCSLVPIPFACSNQLPPGQARPGRGNARPCGYPLGAQASQPATTRTAAAQSLILAVFSGAQATVHGEVVTASEWREELTGVLSVLAQLARRDELGEIAPAAEAAFEAFVGSTAPAARGRPFGRSPNPALLAALVPAATELLAAPSRAAFDDALPRSSNGDRTHASGS